MLISGILYYLTSTPIYQSEAVVYPNAGGANASLSALSGQISNIANLAGINVLDDDSITIQALETLTAKSFVARFISDNQLKKDIYPEKYNFEQGIWLEKSEFSCFLERLFKDVKSCSSAEPSDTAATKTFIETGLTISQDKSNSIIKLSVRMADPNTAKGTLEKLISTINEYFRAEAIKQSRKKAQLLSEELEKSDKVSINEALYSLLENEYKLSIIAQSKDDFVFKIIDPPFTPEKPESPKLIKVMLLFLAAGLIIAIAHIVTFKQIARTLNKSNRQP